MSKATLKLLLDALADAPGRVHADATQLPAEDNSVDAVAMVSMIHQVSDWHTALHEARRVLRPGGKLAVTLITADHLREVSWVYDLFPSMRDFALPHRPSIADLTAALPGAHARPGRFASLDDASIGALYRYPDVFSIALGHDAWTVGEEACVTIDLGGVDHYAKK